MLLHSRVSPLMWISTVHPNMPAFNCQGFFAFTFPGLPTPVDINRSPQHDVCQQQLVQLLPYYPLKWIINRSTQHVVSESASTDSSHHSG